MLDNVGGLTIVDDGSDPDTARELDRISEELGVELVRLPEHRERELPYGRASTPCSRGSLRRRRRS